MCRTKTELVNYKKVMLHLQRSFEQAESDLAVFGAILFSGDGSFNAGDSNGDDKAFRRRQVKLSQELDTLRGMLHVIRSVLASTSSICKTSRFPPPNASTSARMFIASGWRSAAAAQSCSDGHTLLQMPPYTGCTLIWMLKVVCASVCVTCRAG